MGAKTYERSFDAPIGQVWLVVSGGAKADAVAAAIGGAKPVDVPAAGAVGREATVWLLDEDAAAKL